MMASIYECSECCGFKASKPPMKERCNWCREESTEFGEFCSKCRRQDFSFVCPDCQSDVVVDHPDTVLP